MNTPISDMRKEYTQRGLRRSDTCPNPFDLFRKWLDEAIEAQLCEPTAMVVATVSPQGMPSTRTVLLKEVDADRLIFFTNYESRKGIQLDANPVVSITFPWYQLERQVHIEGTIAKISPEASDLYFSTRPYKSRIGARVSAQSRPIESRMQLIRQFLKESLLNIGKEVKRPDHWGGYAVFPVRIEFWQGRESRLHDRICYTLQADATWKIERLSP